MGQSTERFAAARLVKPASVISRLCRTGSYFGTKPLKLPNRRLSWPDDEPEALKRADTRPVNRALASARAADKHNQSNLRRRMQQPAIPGSRTPGVSK